MYPIGELREAIHAARVDGLDLREHPAAVRVLERRGYLPRDRARVHALVDRATRDARVRVATRHGPVQLSFPWNGRWSPDDPEQLALVFPA